MQNHQPIVYGNQANVLNLQPIVYGNRAIVLNLQPIVHGNRAIVLNLQPIVYDNRVIVQTKGRCGKRIRGKPEISRKKRPFVFAKIKKRRTIAPKVSTFFNSKIFLSIYALYM